jgi:hypothetical protein
MVALPKYAAKKQRLRFPNVTLALSLFKKGTLCLRRELFVSLTRSKFTIERRFQMRGRISKEICARALVVFTGREFVWFQRSLKHYSVILDIRICTQADRQTETEREREQYRHTTSVLELPD